MLNRHVKHLIWTPTYGNVSLVVADGEPYVAYNFELEKPDKNIDDAKRRQIAKENAQQDRKSVV